MRFVNNKKCFKYCQPYPLNYIKRYTTVEIAKKKKHTAGRIEICKHLQYKILSACLNLLTLQLHPLKECVFPCCEVGLGQSTQTRDIKWVSGKEGVNILSNAKVSWAGKELSQLPGLQNAFALLPFFWVQYKDTQSKDCMGHNKTAGLLTSNLTSHHFSSGAKMQTDTTPLSAKRTSVLLSQKSKGSFSMWTFRFVKHSQSDLTSDICPSISKYNIQDMMFLKNQTA